MTASVQTEGRAFIYHTQLKTVLISQTPAWFETHSNKSGLVIEKFTRIC